MTTVLVPVLYLGIVVGGLLAFSSFYRRRIAAKRIEPYFPSHPARDTYVTLLQLDPPVADKVLKAALVARAATNVQRVLQLREDKPALQALLQKGSVGDDLWAALLAAEKELEAEILDVVSEANAYVPGWGQIIFETASQIVANDKMRAMFESTARKRQEAEAIYGPSTRTKPTAPQPIANFAPATPAPPAMTPTSSQRSLAPSSTLNGSSPGTPTTPASPLKSPLSKFKELAPLSAVTDSAASSDAESTASSPRSKSAKKNKKKK